MSDIYTNPFTAYSATPGVGDWIVRIDLDGLDAAAGTLSIRATVAGRVVNGDVANTSKGLTYTTASIPIPITAAAGEAVVVTVQSNLAADSAGVTVASTATNAILTAITEGFPQNVAADAEPDGGEVVTGTNTANDADSTHTDDGTHWQIAAASLDGDGFGLSVILTFTLGTTLRPSLLRVNAKRTLLGKVFVWAYNYPTASWDQIADSVTGIGTSGDVDYTYILLRDHQQTADGEVKIRFTSTDTGTSRYLYLDAVFISAVAISELTVADIAQAVWEQKLELIRQDGGEFIAGHMVKRAVAIGTDIAVEDSTTSFTLAEGTTSDDAYNGMLIEVRDESAATREVETRRIVDYTSGRVVTVNRAFSFLPTVGDHVHILNQYAKVDVEAIDGKKTDGTPDDADRPELFLKRLSCRNPDSTGMALELFTSGAGGKALSSRSDGSGGVGIYALGAANAMIIQTATGPGLVLVGSTADLELLGSGTIEDSSGNLIIEQAVANVMDDEIPESPAADSINERLKTLDDDFKARTIAADDYFVVGDYTAPDNSGIAAAKTAAEAVDTLTKEGGAGDLAAVKVKTDTYPFSVTPLATTVSAGGVTTHQLDAFQYSRFGPYTFNIIDSDSNVVNLENKTVKLTVYKPGVPETALHTLSSTCSEIVISSTDYNVLTVTGTDSMTGTAGLFDYQIDNTTDDQKLDTGTVTIEAAHDTT